MYAGTIEINEEVIPNLSFSLKPTAEGHNLAGVTDGGYELRSRGPSSQGFEALDNLVSRVRRPSPPRSRSTSLSTAAAPPSSPPPSPSSSTASTAAQPIMGEQAIADLTKMLQDLSADMATMKVDLASLKDKSSSSSAGAGPTDGSHHNDRPPRFQKMDFPRFNGKSDPLIFINRCESYFHQQRTMPEEKVWMASFNLEDVAQLWYIQLQEDEGTPRWGRFKELLHLRFGPPLRSAPLFELSEFRRTGTVEEYSNRFQALLPRAGRLDEIQRVQLYTGGLLPPLSHAVRIHNPETLANAMSLAR